MKATLDRRGLYGAVQTVRRVAGWDSRVGLARQGSGSISVAAIGQGGAVVAVSNIAGIVKGNGAVVGVTAKPLEKVLKSVSNGSLAVNTFVEGKKGFMEIVEDRCSTMLSAPDVGYSHPETPTPTTPPFAANDLMPALKSVIMAAGKDEARPVLCTVLFSNHGGKLRVTTTDTYRIHLYDLPEVPALSDEPFKIAARELSAIVRMFRGETIQVAYLPDSSEVWVMGETTSVRFRTADGTYPSYEKLLPDKIEDFVTVNRADVRPFLSRLIDLDKYARVRLEFGDGEIALSARVTMHVGAESTVVEPKSTVKATMVGNIPKSLVFDPRYLGEMLDHAGGETVTIAFSDSDRRDPVRVSSDDNPGPFGLLMAIIK